MCNGISRGGFLAAAGAAALPLAHHGERLCHGEPVEPQSSIGETLAELPTLPKGLSAGNAHAAELARDSHFIRAQYAGVLQLANSISDRHLRADVLGLLANPVPKYAQKYQTTTERTALRDALAAKGFVKPDDPVSGIFPPGTDGSAAVQPFWSAPGSAYDSHHSYPGGLLVHELFNARMAEHFAKTYNIEYFNGQSQVDRDLVIAAAFYHDIMKTVVFQYNEDGSLLPELDLAGTGGHHCLSGAESIARGHNARFVTVLLSAHAAPSLGDQVKVATWCRAAAIIAGVDPVEYGLVDRSGNLAALPAIEAFVSHLSDHDYVLSVHAMQQVGPRVEALAPSGESVHWWRHRVLADASAIALYGKLTRSEGEFHAAVLKAAHE